MKIGVDLDDVVFEFAKPFLDFCGERYDKFFEFEDIKSYYFSEILNLPLETVLGLIKEMIAEGFGINQPACEYAEESILQLSKNHEIIFITSRIFREGTEERLKKSFPNMDFKLIYSSNHYSGMEGVTKAEICSNEGIDFMIEDSPEYASQIANEGIRVFLLNKPWNEGLEHEKVIRADNWKEVINHI